MPQHTFTVTVEGDTLTREQAQQVMAERIDHDEDYMFDYTVTWTDDLASLPGTVRSLVVPTEYDVEVRDGQVALSDDRGRWYSAPTLAAAFIAAEAAQDPADPIHHV